jgi:hypothetical protein
MTSTPDRGPVHVISDGSSEGPEDPGHELVMGSDDRDRARQKKERAKNGLNHPNSEIHRGAHLVREPS